MNKIQTALCECLRKDEKVLATFITAGYPHIQSTPEIVFDLEQAGADIVELGMPYSDPLTDGATIQECAQTALKNGVSLERILADVRTIRKHSNIPVVLVCFLNPVLRYGLATFFRDASASGIDGFVFPELPFEEGRRYQSLFAAHEIANIQLVSPTGSPDRILAVDDLATGFLYCATRSAVSGIQADEPVHGCMKKFRTLPLRNPVLLAFGISTPTLARLYGQEADGVIVGSALLRRIARGGTRERFREWVSEFKNVLR